MSAPTSPLPQLHEELFTMVKRILPGLRGLRSNDTAHALSPELFAALVTWNPSAPTTGLAFRLPTPSPENTRRTLIDLIPEVPVGNNLLVPSITSATAPAGTHPVGGNKGVAALAFSGQVEALASVASFIEASDELLDDVAQLQAWLRVYLRWLVTLGEEKEVLTGDGTPGHVRGFGVRGGIPAATDIDEAFAGIVNDTGFLPDAAVLKPKDFTTFLASHGSLVEWEGRTATYLGMSLIPSSAITTKSLVGCFSQGAVLGRNGTILVEGTDSHDLNFTKNIAAIRAASRIALGVLDVKMFRTVNTSTE